MQDKDNKPDSQSPADIAREAFRRLATRRIAPTPDAYRDIYEEIVGTGRQPGAEKALAEFADSLSATSTDIAQFAPQLRRALQSRDWQELGRHLSQLATRYSKLVPDNGNPQQHNASPVVQSPLATERQSIPLVDPVESVPAKSRIITLVDEPALSTTTRGPIPLIDAPPAPSKSAQPMPAISEDRRLQMMRDLLTRTLTLALGSLLRNAPDLAQEAEALAESISEARTEPELTHIGMRLKQFCFKIELRSEDMAEEHELLLRLFDLLLENVSELLEDDSWLAGQIASVQHLLAGPLSRDGLEDAMRSLKEVIYKQGMLKHSLATAQATVKNMMMTFIDRLGVAAASTSDYHAKIDRYAQQISQARGIIELNTILEEVMRDTRAVQTETLRSRDDMLAARQEVLESETRIRDLESKLEQLSELVREDQLTGSLNRRGLDDVFEREFARSERRKSPLCIAMLDLDDFKRLNDTYGHSTGDEVLIHLVRVIKETLRTMDVIGRFGGEEFLIVLPETPLAEAAQTVTRVQRELTKRIFMHNNERLLITFSAGVAMRGPNEDQVSLIKRADEALYRAKREGKNRVTQAD